MKSSAIGFRHWTGVWNIGVFVCIVCVLPTACAEDQFSESFANQHHNQAVMGIVGDRNAIVPADQGLEIHIRPPATENAGIRYSPYLVGDFVVTVNCTLLETPVPSGGHGTGIALLLEDGQSRGASLQRVIMPGGRQFLITHHYTVVDSQYDHQAKQTTFDANEVTLQIERTGESLIYRAAAQGTTDLQELDRVSFTSKPLPVAQVYGQTGGAANEVNVRIDSIKIIADELLRPGQPSRVDDGTKTTIIGGVVLCLAAVATGLFLLRQRRKSAQ
ncbi:MAG: hypothetical protein KDA96_14155 [Planctomycetaceae bacterium]|nr:hypothetical protein [Planctomycetaceae bacterium]